MQSPREINATIDFLKAAAAGDMAGLQAAYAQGAAVNRSGKDGQTALLLAGQHGDANMLAYLFSIGADARAQDAQGNDALMKTISGGHTPAAQICLKQPFNLAATNVSGLTAFAHAALHGMSDVMDDMVAKGANHNLISSDGRTPLIHAAAQGKLKTVDKIFTFDSVAINAQDKEGQTALMTALMGGHRETAARLLIEGARPDISDKRGRDVMFYARQWGLEDEIREAFRRYDVTQITQGARHEINVLKPINIRRRPH